MALDPTQKLGKAEALKTEGNERFKEKLYKKALISYAKGIAYVKNLPGSSRSIPEGIGHLAAMASTTESLDADIDKKSMLLEVVLHTNIAMCHIKLGDGVKCLEAVSKALALNPTALKALLRKCEGYLLLNNFEKANELMQEAMKHADADQTVLAFINELKKKIVRMEKEQVLRQKEMFSKIFKD